MAPDGVNHASADPRYIRLDSADNVAIVVNDFGLPAGTSFACGLTLRELVPQGHKVALRDMAAGAPILRYGEVIGTAARAIPRGSWVDEVRWSACRRRPGWTSCAGHAGRRRAPARRRLEGYTFEGFATRTARSAPGTCWASAPACNASPARWNLRQAHPAETCCRNIPMSTMSSG